MNLMKSALKNYRTCINVSGPNVNMVLFNTHKKFLRLVGLGLFQGLESLEAIFS